MRKLNSESYPFSYVCFLVGIFLFKYNSDGHVRTEFVGLRSAIAE